MLTALFTSSDRQLDTKERRRYELKLSKAPNMRTAIIALLAIFVISSGLTALGAEIKVTDVQLACCVSVASHSCRLEPQARMWGARPDRATPAWSSTAPITCLLASGCSSALKI
jgi:hypothetical protein